MARIENHMYTIEEAFRECFYIVPDYQREYVWSEKEVLQLLNDIDEQVDLGVRREYFVGTILVSPTLVKNHYEVIDGQQRLTTFFLLLCALRHLFKGTPQEATISGLISTSYTDGDGETRTSLKLDPRYENAAEVMTRIVALAGDPLAVRSGIHAAGIASFGSLGNLVKAYGTLHSFVKDNYSDVGKLKKYWGYLATNVVFIQICTDVSSALKIFETINERGVGLNPMDLLKNLLFTHVGHDEFAKLKDEWKKITRSLEQAGEKPLRFLRYVLMANYEIKMQKPSGGGSESVVREDEIYDWFVDKTNAGLAGYKLHPFDFVRKVNRNVDHYVNFAKGRGNDGGVNTSMDSLKRLCGGAFSLHFILLLAAANLPKPMFDHFVEQLESFLFFYIFTKTPTKELERNFSLWADDLRAISCEADIVVQRARLNVFIADRFQKSMDDKNGELTDALRRYTLNTMQQYRTRYLLARLTQYVEMAFKGMTIRGNLADFTDLQIEHVLPNTPRASLMSDFNASNPGADYEAYKIRLGNLTLLEKPINIVANNDFFQQKKPEYLKSGNYMTRSLCGLTQVGVNTSTNRINLKLQAYDEWSAKTIDDRQERLIALASQVWKTAPY